MPPESAPLARLVWASCCNRRACLALHPSAPLPDAYAALRACSSHPLLSSRVNKAPPAWHLCEVPPYDLHRAFGHPDSELLPELLPGAGRGDWLEETARATLAFYASALGATRGSPALKLLLVAALAAATLRESGLEWRKVAGAAPRSMSAAAFAALRDGMAEMGLGELLKLAARKPWLWPSAP